MHELGIVVHIVRTLEDVAQENSLTDIRRVTLQIGKVSGIEPDYLVDCWEYYKKKVPLLKYSTLDYEWIEAITICHNCQKHLFYNRLWQRMSLLSQWEYCLTARQ